MIINSCFDLIFVSTPKCAGTSIEWFLKENNPSIILHGPQDLKHADATFLKEMMIPFLHSIYPGKTFTSFSLIREPVSYLFSWWRYRGRKDIIGKMNSTYGISFNDFVLEVLRDGERMPFANIHNQREFVITSDGKVAVDKVFAYENFNKVLCFLAKTVNKSVNLYKINESPSSKFGPLDLLKDSTKSHVKEFFEVDILIHNAALVSPDKCKQINCFASHIRQ